MYIPIKVFITYLKKRCVKVKLLVIYIISKFNYLLFN